MPRPAKRADYGTGAYRRRIRVIAGEREVSGELEDDFHHFRARLEHDGERLTRVVSEALRVPWTTCPGSVRPIERLVGMDLSRSLRAAAAFTPPQAQCTHLLDAAAAAISFAARGQPGRRQWDVEVPDRKQSRTRATLAIDGEPTLAWEVHRFVIVGPEPFAGRPLIGGFGRWAEDTLDAELAEAAQILQRAVYISTGRRSDFEKMERALEHREVMGSSCHTFGDAHIGRALRVKGSVRDYSARPDALMEVQPEPIAPDALERPPDAPAHPEGSS